MTIAYNYNISGQTQTGVINIVEYTSSCLITEVRATSLMINYSNKLPSLQFAPQYVKLESLGKLQG